MSLQRVAFSPLHTFTRATDETFFNQIVDSFGNVSYELQTAPSGTAVQNAYNPSTGEPLGLQVFEQRTNLFLRSQEFDSANWSKTNTVITANAITAPDGTLTAEKAVATSVSGVHTVAQAVGGTVGSYTFSAFVKAAEYDVVRVNTGTSANGFAEFNLTNETFTSGGTYFTSASIISVGDGWFRISLTMTDVPQISWGIVMMLDGQIIFTGDDVSGVYLWGLQVEAGSFPTPYIKTEATTATRNASVAVINDIDESEWWNPSEGTFVVELTRSSVNAIRSERIIEVSDGTTANRVLIQKAAGLNLGQIITINGGVSVINDFTISQALDSVKIAFNLTSSAFKLSLNGGSVASFSETIPLSGFSQLRIGTAITGMFLNGHIAKIQYYPTAVSDAKLQELSTL